MKIEGARLLVVEDDPTLGAIWADIMEEAGAEVAGTCPSVARALDAVAERAPAVAMLDIHLQDGTSFPFAEALTALQVPFLFISSCEPREVPSEFRGRPYCVSR